VSLKAVNKKTLEGLANAGGFDCFTGIHRAQYFATGNDDSNVIEKSIRYGNAMQQNESASQHSLFGGGGSINIPEPTIPPAEEWTLMDKLNREREVIGIYLSGHPLDPFNLEIEKLTTHKLTELSDAAVHKNKDVKFAGIVSAVNHRVSKQGKPFGSFTLEDFTGSLELTLFGDDYINNRKFMELGYSLYLKGKVQNRWGRPDDWEIKLNQVEMLTDIREKYIKSIMIDLTLEEVTDKLLSFIQVQAKAYPGNALLNFTIVDNSGSMAVSLFSSKIKVGLSNDLLKSLDEFGLRYKLN
jgi:DNA polymerase-3 subunit alpha